MDPSSDEGKLFIGGIGWDTTEERLKDHFGRYGEVAHAIIMRDRITAQPRGFGFVVFADPSVIPSVLQQAHTIDGRTVEAKKAMSREQQQTLRSGSTSTGGNFGGPKNLKTKKIFVGGLPSTLTEDQFKEHFQDYGTISDVVIMYDPNTSRPRGFGFITFSTEEAVDRVLQKTFHELNGKLVEVKQALPKDTVIGGGVRGRGNYRGGYGSYISGGRGFGSQIGSNGFIQASGGYPAYSGYGYVGNSNVGYGGYGGYGVGGYANTNAGYTGSPSSNFLRNQWTAGYGASGYGGPGYGGSFPLGNAYRSSSSGYAAGGRSPGGASRYVDNGYNYSGYGGTEISHAYGGGGGGGGHGGGGGYGNNNRSSGHIYASWKPEA